MGRVTCPQCGFTVGLGVASEPGRCPSCDVELMLTIEMRALTTEQVRRSLDKERVSSAGPARTASSPSRAGGDDTQAG